MTTTGPTPTGPVGTTVRLTSGPDTAVIIAVHETCPHPGCPHRAYTVRRDPGSFPLWDSETGLFHAADTVKVIP